jgi:hypothetical protein
MLDGRRWTFWATTPEAVLHCLQQLGYPVTLPPGTNPATVNRLFTVRRDDPVVEGLVALR